MTWAKSAGTRQFGTSFCGVGQRSLVTKSNPEISIIKKVKIWHPHLLGICRYLSIDNCRKEIGPIAPFTWPPRSWTCRPTPSPWSCDIWWPSSGCGWNFSLILFAPGFPHQWQCLIAILSTSNLNSSSTSLGTTLDPLISRIAGVPFVRPARTRTGSDLRA